MKNLEAFVGIRDRIQVLMIPDEACNVTRVHCKKTLLSASGLHGHGVEGLPCEYRAQISTNTVGGCMLPRPKNKNSETQVALH